MKRSVRFAAPFVQSIAATGGPFAIAKLRAWRLREPDSGRRYTIVRVTSHNGVSGFGEGGATRSADLVEAQKALADRRATALEFVRHRFADTPAVEAAIGNALLDLSARATGVPLYRYLGGPVRFKTRMMARLAGVEQLGAAQADGYRMFTVRVPPRESMTPLQTYVDSVRKSVEDFKKAAGDPAEVVLDAGGVLLPGDAAVVARALERTHPVWFDEPTGTLSQDALSRITDESTMPVGLGRNLHAIGDFQNLLRLGCVDVIRPSLGLNSLHKIRRMAAIAETHYIAVAPYHDGGPLATMFGIHLGGSISNFYVQETPVAVSARDRAMRTEILGGAPERVADGFAQLVNQPGLGVRVDEQALDRYSEETV